MKEGLQDHLIMEAIYESAKTGKPVKIDASKSNSSLHGSEPDVS